jgi:hypothetical protein
MSQPPSYKNKRMPNYVRKLYKALYDLKQAPCAWYSRLSKKLCEVGFQASKANTSLFHFHHNDITMFVLVFVDDIIITSSSQKATEHLLHKLSQEFALKDLGDLYYFLGIEVHKVSDGIVLTQEKYALDLLKKVGIGDCKPVASPMSTSKKLSIFDGSPLAQYDSTQYQPLYIGWQ